MKRFCLGLIMAASLLITACVGPVGDRSEFLTRQSTSDVAADGTVRFAEGTYRGLLKDNRPNGKGTFAFTSGTRYVGDFVDGRANGQGEMHYTDGRVVKGEYRNDVEYRTQITYADGRSYTGDVVKGQPLGAGTMRFVGGETLTGNFRNGRAEGMGLLSDATGRAQYAGPFRSGQPHGDGYCGGSPCSKIQGKDVTEQLLREKANQEVNRGINSKFDAEVAGISRELDPRIDAANKEARAAQTEYQGWSGPDRDDPCYCELTGFCLLVSSWDETTEERELGKIAWERQKLQCRQSYSAYLKNRGRSDYSAELARLDQRAADVRKRHADLRAEKERRSKQIEAARQRLLADEAAKRSLAEAEAAKEKAKRDAKRERDKRMCSAGGLVSNPCHCSAVLNIPLKPGGACEA